MGVLIFICASFADARRRQALAAEGQTGLGIGAYLGWSVLLSLGLGMLSGGIQHFLDFPHYAAALLPLGFVLSLAAYLAREGKVPERPRLLVLSGGAVAVALAAYLGLDHLAHDIEGSGHPH